MGGFTRLFNALTKPLATIDVPAQPFRLSETAKCKAQNPPRLTKTLELGKILTAQSGVPVLIL